MIRRQSSNMSSKLSQAFLLLLLLILPLQSRARWLTFGSYQEESNSDFESTAISIKEATTATTTSKPATTTAASSSSNFLVQFFYSRITDAFRVVLHKLGNYLPLRGVASVASDLGVPGGDFILEALTPMPSQPSSQPAATHFTLSDAVEPRQGTSTGAAINPRFSAWARSDTVEDPEPTPPPPSYREEVSSIMGTMFGEKQCLMKLACLSGKRLSAVKGASALTMVLSTVAGVMPESMQDPYHALKNSIMYTDDCQQYQCGDVGNTEL